MMSVKASNAAWLAPGSRLDRYDLLLQVAEGGMGLLWLARQQGKHGFDRIVAIKTILPKLASDTGFQRMFLDEARVVSRIEHPNVAQVLDLGEERGVLFLVMEWIDGESLFNVGRAVAKDDNAFIPVGVLTRIMIDVCAGLQAAHDLADDEGLPLGVVHRDISPHNLLVGFRGTTKVIDFGIAKAKNRMSQDTSIGLLKGKVAYMAPEQAMGLGVDHRTDVWSAGASMYRFLSGCAPYSASDPLAVLRRIAERLPAAPLPATVPEPIRLVVMKALEIDAEKRFGSARQMGAALESAMRASDTSTSRDDVAAFMTEHLGEGRETRTREIEHAVRESRARMRVEVARTESVPVPEPEAAIVNDLLSGSPAFSAEPADPSHGLESGFDGRFRPSGHPTAILGVARMPSNSCDVSQSAFHPAIDSAQPTAKTDDTVAVPPPSAPLARRVRRWVSRPSGRWIGGVCLLATLVASGLALRAAQPSRAVAIDLTAPASSLPAAAATSPSIPSAPASEPAPTPTAALAPAPTPALVPAPAPTFMEPRAPDRVSTDNLLERARQARRAGRIDEAATLFAAAVEKAPADSEALTGLAEVDDAQGATAKAIATYRRALAYNPGYLPARLGLADSLWTSRQRDEARAVYRSIVDQVPLALCPPIARERAAGGAGSAKTAQ